MKRKSTRNVIDSTIRRFPIFSFLIVLFYFQAGTLFSDDGSVVFPPEHIYTEAQKAQQRQDGAQLVAAIAALGNNSTYIATNKTYRIAPRVDGTPPFDFWSKSNITVDFNGSMIFIEDASGCSFLRVHNSNNIVVKNACVDYDPHPFVQGKITYLNLNELYMKVKLDDNFSDTITFFKDTVADTIYPEVWATIWNSDGTSLKNAIRFRCKNFLSKEKEADGSYLINICGITPNMYTINISTDRIALSTRGPHNILVRYSHDVTLENITMYAAPCYGLIEQNATGQNTYKNVNFVKMPNTTRLLVLGGDVFNIDNSRVGPVVDGCTAERGRDDFVNVHGGNNAVVTQINSTTLVVAYWNYWSDIEDDSTIQFFKYNVSGNEYLGSRQIASCTLLSNYTIPVNCLYHETQGVTPGTVLANAYQITLDQPIVLDGASNYSLPDYSSKGAVIKNNTVKNVIPRGVLLYTHDSIVEDNYFEWLGDTGVMIGPNYDQIIGRNYANLGSFAYNNIIRNNYFKNIGISDPSFYVAIDNMQFLINTYYHNEIYGNVIEGNTAPTASFITPVNNTQYNTPGALSVQVQAADSDGTIQQVDLYLDDTFIRTARVAPYNWGSDLLDFPLKNLPEGTHTLTAKAVDNNGASTSVSISITGSKTVVTEFEAESGSVLTPMQIKNDDQTASSGEYVAVLPGYNSFDNPPVDGICTYSFSVAAGVYNIECLIKTPTATADSFWIKVDDGAWVKWNGTRHLADWHWETVWNSDDESRVVSYNFPQSGNHTLYIAYREYGAELDKIRFVVASNPDSVELEAESGTIQAPMMINNDDQTASSGEYITVQPGYNSFDNAPANGICSYSFNLAAGVYYIECLVKTPSATDDSFWIKIDDGDWIKWACPQNIQDWYWATVSDVDDSNQVVYLDFTTPGNHTLYVAYREDGAKMDMIKIARYYPLMLK